MKTLPITLALVALAASAGAAEKLQTHTEATVTSDTTETVSHPPESEATLAALVAELRTALSAAESGGVVDKGSPMAQELLADIPRMQLACTMARYQAAHSRLGDDRLDLATYHCDEAMTQVQDGIAQILRLDDQAAMEAIRKAKYADPDTPCAKDERPGCKSLPWPDAVAGFRIKWAYGSPIWTGGPVNEGRR